MALANQGLQAGGRGGGVAVEACRRAQIACRCRPARAGEELVGRGELLRCKLARRLEVDALARRFRLAACARHLIAQAPYLGVACLAQADERLVDDADRFGETLLAEEGVEAASERICIDDARDTRLAPDIRQFRADLVQALARLGARSSVHFDAHVAELSPAIVERRGGRTYVALGDRPLDRLHAPLELGATRGRKEVAATGDELTHLAAERRDAFAQAGEQSLLRFAQRADRIGARGERRSAVARALRRVGCLARAERALDLGGTELTRERGLERAETVVDLRARHAEPLRFAARDELTLELIEGRGGAGEAVARGEELPRLQCGTRLGERALGRRELVAGGPERCHACIGCARPELRPRALARRARRLPGHGRGRRPRCAWPRALPRRSRGLSPASSRCASRRASPTTSSGAVAARCRTSPSVPSAIAIWAVLACRTRSVTAR